MPRTPGLAHTQQMAIKCGRLLRVINCPTNVWQSQPQNVQRDNTLISLFNSGNISQSQMIVECYSSILNIKCADSFIDTTYWCLHYCYGADMVVSPGDNIQTYSSHRAQQKLLCSRTICMFSRAWKLGQPCCFSHVCCPRLTSPVSRCTISKACLTMRMVSIFLPLLRPCIMSELVSLSTMGHWAFLKRFTAKRPAEWGRYLAYLSLTPM